MKLTIFDAEGQTMAFVRWDKEKIYIDGDAISPFREILHVFIETYMETWNLENKSFTYPSIYELMKKLAKYVRVYGFTYDLK